MEHARAPSIPVAAPTIGEREIAYVTDALRSGWVSSIGPYIDRFEGAFAEYVGARHAIAVSNGTVALHLALHAMGVGPGDEVILPDLTFAATAHTVLQVGATPVFADVDPMTWCLDPRAVEQALSPRTRVIVPVHLYGHPADVTALRALPLPAGVRVLEDAAEAHGATVDGVKTGALGDIAAFSFYGNKLMTTGEGGMLTTSDDALAQRCRFLKDHGMSPARRYYHTELAFNYRMTNLQAALGLAQLEQLDGFIDKRRGLMRLYREALAGVPGLQLNPIDDRCHGVFWMVSAVLGDELAVDRDEVARILREDGIDSRPFFVPMSELPHLKDFPRWGASERGCPVSGRLSHRGLNLPSGNGLSSRDVERVTGALQRALG